MQIRYSSVSPRRVSCKLEQCKPQFAHRDNCLVLRIIHTCCPVWLKFSVRNVHIVTFCISGFWANWRRECRTVLTGVNKITFACTVKPCDQLKVKNASVKSAYYVDGYIILKLVTDGYMEALPYLSTLMHSNPTTLSLQSAISCCFVAARLSHNGLYNHYSPQTLATKEVVTLSDNCRLLSHFAFLISLRVTCDARAPPTWSAKRRHEVTNNTRQICYSFCTKNIHLKFSVIWWTERMHFLLNSVEKGRWRALECSLSLSYSLHRAESFLRSWPVLS